MLDRFLKGVQVRFAAMGGGRLSANRAKCRAVRFAQALYRDDLISSNGLFSLDFHVGPPHFRQ
jgi:hypothetical protein